MEPNPDISTLIGLLRDCMTSQSRQSTHVNEPTCANLVEILKEVRPQYQEIYDNEKGTLNLATILMIMSVLLVLILGTCTYMDMKDQIQTLSTNATQKDFVLKYFSNLGLGPFCGVLMTSATTFFINVIVTSKKQKRIAKSALTGNDKICEKLGKLSDQELLSGRYDKFINSLYKRVADILAPSEL